MTSARDKLWDNLIETAFKDGEITKEEEILIKRIMNSFEAYEQALKEALEDKKITLEEKQKLSHLREKIWKDAYAYAQLDHAITIDEHDILIKLVKSLRDLAKEEG